MAIAYVERTSPQVRLSEADGASGSTDREVLNPGCVDGELLIAIQSQSGGTSAAMTADTGTWLQKGDTGGSASVGWMKIWYRIASNEPVNWVFGGDGDGVVTVLVIENWDQRGGDLAWDVEPTFNTGSATADQDAPSITMVRSTNRLIVAYASEDEGPTHASYEVGFTEIEDTALSGSHAQAVASQETGDPGTTGAMGSTASAASDYVAVAFAISSPPNTASAVAAPSVLLPHWSTADNTLVAIVAANSIGQTGATDCQVSSIIDDAHNTWVPVPDATDFVTGYPGEPNTAVRLSMWYCAGARAITQLTVTMTQSVDSLALQLVEASGVTNVSTLDVAEAGNDNDDLAVVASKTTTNATDLVIAASATGNSNRTFTNTDDGGFESPNGGLLDDVDTDSGTSENDVLLRSAYKITSSAAAQSITWTLGDDGNGVWAILALKAGDVSTDNENDFWPKMTHELGFGVDPNDATAVVSWTDVTTRVLSFSARRGRDYELARTEAGEADIRLRNDDGAFDPANTSSTFSPNVKIFTPYRIRAEWDGQVHSIFQGYVERWPQLWDDEYGTSPMQAVDGLATLSATRLIGTLGSEIEADEPVAYWPMDDGRLATTAANKAETTTTPLKIEASDSGGGSGFFGADLDLQGEESTCWEQTIHSTADSGTESVAGVCLYAELDLPTLAEGILVECWARFEETDSSLPYGILALKSSAGDSDPILEIEVDSLGGAASLHILDGSGTLDEYPSGVTGLNDNKWHHYVAHLVNPVSGDTTAKLWIDGALRVDQTIDSLTTSDPNRIFVGGQADENVNHHFMAGRIAHVAVFELDESDDRRVAARASAGLFGFPEKTGARMSRLLNYTNWTAGRAIDEGQTLLGSAASIANQTLLAAVQDVANWENGLAFVDSAGNFRFVDRLQHFNENTKWVFGEDEANGEIPYETDVEIQYDPKYVYNDVKVTKSAGRTSAGGASVRKRDQESIKSYFTRNLDKTSGAASLTQCELEAQWTIDEYAQPRLRLAHITITPSANPDLWPVALTAEIGDRVTVKRRPFGGAEITLDCYIEQVNHQVMPNKWTVTYSLSPRLDSTYEGDSSWILGTSTLGLDTYLGP